MFAWGFSIVVKTGFISKSFKTELQSIFNFESLSKTTLRGIGKRDSRVLLNNWRIMADVLLMYFVMPIWTSLEL